MRHFFLLLLVGSVAAGYVYREDLESAWSQWRTSGNFSALSGMQSFGHSLNGQFQRFGSGIDSLNH
jgi:hypothetical protein